MSKKPGKLRQVDANLLARIALLSRNADEAAEKLSVCRESIYRALKRNGIKPPSHWTARMFETLGRYRTKVPEVVIPNPLDRAWIGALVGADGSISCSNDHRKKSNLTVIVAMTDKAWVDHFARIVGGKPSHFVTRLPPEKPIWNKTVAGLRGFRVLREILPFLMGGKRREAQRALEFFSPDGYRRGLFSPLEVWPPSEFPLRKRAGRLRRYP